MPHYILFPQHVFLSIVQCTEFHCVCYFLSYLLRIRHCSCCKLLNAYHFCRRPKKFLASRIVLEVYREFWQSRLKLVGFSIVFFCIPILKTSDDNIIVSRYCLKLFVNNICSQFVRRAHL